MARHLYLNFYILFPNGVTPPPNVGLSIAAATTPYSNFETELYTIVQAGLELI